MRTTTFTVALLAAVSLMLPACAGDVQDLDRTQPGKLKKAALDGEWFFRQTVVDVPYTTGVTFIGEQSILDRIRWEISEDTLTAYRTYERVEGSEIPSTLSGEEYQGAPVAAFQIVGHLDVVREYNAATGEQTNVLIENDFDRPWYEREYIRVDWSENLLANFDFIAAGQEGLGVITQSASYAVTDPTNPDAPVFATRTGNAWTDTRDPVQWGSLDRIDYFDVTLKLQVTPDTFEMYWDDGTSEKWPACWFYDMGVWDCASQTIEVRAAFLRAAPSDYEPLHYPDNYVARDDDGNAVLVRDPITARLQCDCDENFGCDNGCSCDAECDAAVLDGQCTREERDETGACHVARVPMFDRFGYFRTEREHYDRDYELTEEGRVYWINRFNIWERSKGASGDPLPYAERTVRPLIYYLSPEFPEARVGDAMQVGRWWNDAFTETVESLGADPGEDAFRIVPNTYAVDEDKGTITDFGQRNGDLRYNHLYWVDDPQFEALLGYGPSGADPLTGEIIAADAYVYGAAIDSYGTYGADIIDLMRGDILESEFIEGEHVGAFLANLRDGGTPEGRDAVRDRVQRVLDGGAQERMRNVRERGPHAFERQHDWVGARLERADDNPVFDALWSDELRSAYESHFGRPLRPSEFGGRRLVRALQRHRRKLGARAVDLRAFDDEAVLHLVRELEDAPREEVIDTIRSYIFKSTAAHEIGHTLGLRHNFAGSTDALNYSDTYWDIRDPAARTLDLPTAAEQTEGLREHAYSSLMDYSAKFMGDIRGLGRYDVAAIKFGYGQLVEVFDSPVTHPLALRDDDGDGDPEYGAYELEELGDFIHYTSWPNVLSTSGARDEGIANMRARSNVPYEDVVSWLRREDGAESFRGRVVPYKFCSDEYDGAEWDCATFDEGADPYEIVSFAAQDHRDYYIFRAFKRHRRFVDPIDYYYSTYWRAMFPMSTQYQMWVFDQWTKAGEYDFLDYWGWFTDDAALTAFRGTGDWNTHPDGGLAAASASVTAVNFLAEVLAMPEPGSYWQDPSNPGTLIWWTADEDVICGPGEVSAVDPCSDIYIPVTPESRYALSEFDPGSGYYWYEKVSIIGSFWDKLAAIETLSDPSTYFLGVDDVADYSTYVIGFNVAFPRAVDTLFGSIINEDYAKFGAEATPEGDFVIRPYLDGSDELGADRPLDGNTAVIDPATNFTVSLYTMWYGMALLNANFDQSFNDNAKIWLEGSGEAFTPDPSLDPADIATFNNPFNGRMYKSVKSTDPNDYSLGFEVVSRAATLATYLNTNDCVTPGPGDAEYCDSRRWELQLLIENIELMRGYYDFLGYAWW